MHVLGEKYELAKTHIKQDRGKIHSLQDDLDAERREKRRLSDSLDNQCRITNEAERKAEEAERAHQILVDEMDKLVAERDNLVAAVATSEEEIRRLRQQLQASEEGHASKDKKIAELEAERARLHNENIDLSDMLKDREDVIVGTSDSIDVLLYNIWKNGGICGWSEDYNVWMLMISKRSFRKARRKAEAEGKDFDK